MLAKLKEKHAKLHNRIHGDASSQTKDAVAATGVEVADGAADDAPAATRRGWRPGQMARKAREKIHQKIHGSKTSSHTHAVDTAVDGSVPPEHGGGAPGVASNQGSAAPARAPAPAPAPPRGERAALDSSPAPQPSSTDDLVAHGAPTAPSGEEPSPGWRPGHFVRKARDKIRDSRQRRHLPDTSQDAGDEGVGPQELESHGAGGEIAAPAEEGEGPGDSDDDRWFPGKLAKKARDTIRSKLHHDDDDDDDHGSTAASTTAVPTPASTSTSASASAPATSSSGTPQDSLEGDQHLDHSESDGTSAHWTPRRLAERARAKRHELAARIKASLGVDGEGKGEGEREEGGEGAKTVGDGSARSGHRWRPRDVFAKGRAALRAKLSRKRTLRSAGSPAAGGQGAAGDGAMAPFARLSVSVLRAEHCEPGTYVEVLCEGQEYRTAVDASVGTTCTWSDATTTLRVLDPTSDVHLHVLVERALRPEKVLGRAVVPIVSLLSGLTTARPPTTMWLQLYPTRRAHQVEEGYSFKLEAGVRGVKGSAMPLPPQPRPRLLVRVALTPVTPPLLAFVTAPPFLEHDGAAGHDGEGEDGGEGEQEQEQEGGKVEPRVLKGNIKRLVGTLGPPSLWPVMMTRPGVAVLWLLHVHMCFRAALWQLPLFFFCFVLVNGVLAARQRRLHPPGGDLIVWESEVGHKPPERGVLAKLRLLKGVMYKLQRFTGHAARHAEVWTNAWNFSDVRSTTLVMLALLVACVVLALVLSVVPASVLLFVLGAAPLVVLSAVVFGVVGGAARGDTKQDPTPPASSSSNAAGASPRAGDAPQVGHGESDGVVGRMKSAAMNLLARIPDEHEMVHRRLCSMATEVVQQGGASGDAAAPPAVAKKNN